MSALVLTAQPRAEAGRLASFGWREFLAGIALALVFALTHPFGGIEHDSRIYMGRVLADLDPGGVGRDLMFRLDGQSSFSVFRLVAKGAVETLGLGRAVLALSLVNMVTWFAAIAVLARVLFPGRAIVLGLAAACVLSMVYAPWQLIAAGETFPVPRPLAEAAVLLALAAICKERLLLALGLLLVAATFHPIMALPGFGVLFVVACLREKRWLGLCLLAIAALGAAAACGMPLVGRAMVRVDPEWGRILVERNAYLYIGRWPLGPAASVLLVRAVTIVIACTFVGQHVRRVLLAGLGVGVAGLLASFLLGDLCGNLLVLQAQLWRALWLPAALAPLAAGICLWRLPQRGPAGQMTLAFLVAAWACLDWTAVAPLMAGLALAAHIGATRLSVRLDRLAITAWLLVGALVAFQAWLAFGSLAEVMRSMPPEAGSRSIFIGQLHVAVLPVMLLAFAWWHWRDHARTLPCSLAVVAVLVGLFATQWESRDAAKAATDSGLHEADLAAMLASRRGPVLWLEGDEAWYWLGRANWNGQIQGASIVFSREQAIEWRRRAEAIVAAGLASPYLLHPLDTPAPVEAPKLDAARIEAFCAGFDGKAEDEPAWIVAPMDDGSDLAPRLHARIWTAPAPRFDLAVRDGGLHWRRFERYAIMPCAPGAK